VDPITLPENLSDRTVTDDAALKALQTSVTAAAAELRQQAADLREAGERISPELVEQIEALAEKATAITTEKATRVAADQELADRAERALGALPEEASDPDPEPEAEPEAEPEPEPDPEPEAEEDPEEEAKAPAPVAVAPAPAAPAPAPVAVAATAEPTPEAALAAATPAPEAAVTTPAPETSGSVAGLSDHQPEALAAKPKAGGLRDGFMLATQWASGSGKGEELANARAVAEVMTQTRHSWSRGRIPSGTFEFVPVATANWQREFSMSGEHEENFGPLADAVMAARPALVASGACCTPLSPSYDFFRLSEAVTPIEDATPVVGAPRGGVRYIQPVDWRAALEAIGIQTCADNNDPENPDLKPCLHVDCPEVADATVTAVSQCVEFGNLGYRTFPELTASFLEDVAVAFAVKKETLYLDYIHANSTVVTGIATGYGFIRNLAYNVTLAATGYRRRNRMAPNSPLQLALPSWTMEAALIDAGMDGDEGLEYLAVGQAYLNRVFASHNLNVIWYVDSAAGLGQTFDGAQAAGALNPWPSAMVGYLYSPGTFVRMDGGTLDVGLVRDSVLNARNDLQIFMEEWTGLVKLGVESIALALPVFPNGDAPIASTGFSC